MVSPRRWSALSLLLVLAVGASALPLSLGRLAALNGTAPPAAKGLAAKKADLLAHAPQTCQDCKKPFDPKRDPVDMVFTWVNYSNSVYSEAVGKACGSKNPGVSGDQANTFIELKYALRSLEKHGLMKQIRKIFVVMSDSHPPPAWLKPKPGKLEVVTHSSLMKHSKFGVKAPIVASLNSIMAVIHYIPGLSNWFIYSGDDQFLMRPFSWESVDLYDLKESKVISHLNQGINPAANDSWYGAAAHTASLLDSKFGGRPRNMDGYHCPVFVNKCILRLARKLWPEELKATAANYCGLKPKVVQWETLYGNLAEECGIGRRTSNMSSFTDELHTNKYGTDENAAKELRRTLAGYAAGQHQWVNLQGDGISDEYPKNAMVHEVAYGWLDQQFPTPTAYEKVAKARPNGAKHKAGSGSSQSSKKN